MTDPAEQCVIYKYPLPVGAVLDLPLGHVVHVGTRHPDDAEPTVWVRHRVDMLHTSGLRLAVVATGERFDAAEVSLGSAVCLNGMLVWHVVELDDDGPEQPRHLRAVDPGSSR